MTLGYSEGEKRKVAAIVAGGMGLQHTDGSVRRELSPVSYTHLDVYKRQSIPLL